MTIIRPDNTEQTHVWIANAKAAPEADGMTACLATAQVYATLAVADGLAKIRAELGYIGNAIAEDHDHP